MKERIKNQKGITLIALIITIVVLMILAAVAINSITNEGIIGHAGNTAETYNQAVKNEESYLQDYEDMLTAANGGYKDKNFEVGDEVSITIGSETHNFYVIEDKTALGKVVLLAKEFIEPDKTKSNYLTQSPTASSVAFSETSYWWDDENWCYKDEYITDGLTEKGIPDESHYAARAAYDYGAKLGAIGRLPDQDYNGSLYYPSIPLEDPYWTCVGGPDDYEPSVYVEWYEDASDYLLRRSD